jgi:hypothetical protein
MRAATVVAIALFAGACGARAEPAKPAAQTGVGWRQLGTWSGRGNAQTASFTSDTGALRVRWQASPAPRENAPGSSSPSLRIAAHSAISGRLLQPVVEHAGAGEGIGYVQQDPHVFFMVVEASQLNWTVTVEEAVGYP